MAKLADDKHERFCQEYLIDLSQTNAAIRAGYSPGSAKVHSCWLMKKKDIRGRIDELLDIRSKKMDITAEKVLLELAKIGFSNMQDYMSVHDGDPFVDLSALTRDQAAAIQEFTVDEYQDGRGDDARDVKRIRIKLSDKRAALVDIGRHLGMFKDKIEHDVSDPLKELLKEINGNTLKPKG